MNWQHISGYYESVCGTARVHPDLHRLDSWPAFHPHLFV